MFQPPTMPWTLQNTNNIAPPMEMIKHGIKRKTVLTPDATVVPPPPEKHFVTEEEMTAEMRRLNLLEQEARIPDLTTHYARYSYYPNFQERNTEVNFTPYSYPSSMHCQASRVSYDTDVLKQEPLLRPFLFNAEGQFTGFGVASNIEIDEDVGEISTKEDSLPRLYVSEELMKIQPTPFLPPSLMDSLPSRQLALVPWVPPIVLKREDEKDKKTNEKIMDVL